MLPTQRGSNITLVLTSDHDGAKVENPEMLQDQCKIAIEAEAVNMDGCDAHVICITCDSQNPCTHG
jgi:hypothetical protein